MQYKFQSDKSLTGANEISSKACMRAGRHAVFSFALVLLEPDVRIRKFWLQWEDMQQMEHECDDCAYACIGFVVNLHMSENCGNKRQRPKAVLNIRCAKARIGTYVGYRILADLSVHGVNISMDL